MIKVSTLKKEFKRYLKENHIQFVDLNKIHKEISIPMYMINIKVTEDDIDETFMEVPVMVTIFPVGGFIYFDAFNIYKSTKRSLLKTFKVVNSMNQFALPGKFIIDDDNFVSYRCVMDYKNMDTLNFLDLDRIIDSIPSANYLFFEQLEKNNNEQ